MGNIIIRNAAESDVECISVLATQVWLDNYAPGGIRKTIADEVLRAFNPLMINSFINSPQIICIVAERESHLIGYSQVSLNKKQELIKNNEQAELDRLYVQEPFTGQGVGSMLLEKAEKKSFEHGAQVLWLTAWIYNTRALNFYNHKGYTDFGKTYFHMENESHENRVLGKYLNNAE